MGAGPGRSRPRRGFRRALRRVATPPILVAAAAVLLFEEFFWRAVASAAAALARTRAVAAAERWAMGLGPYPTLLLFAVPMVALEPVKILALYLIGTGRVVAGTAALAGAHALSTLLAVRLYAISLPKLLSIPWFAWAHGAFLGARARLYAYLRGLPGWRAAAMAVRRAREGVRAAARRLRGTGRPWALDRLRAGRRWLGRQPRPPRGP